MYALVRHKLLWHNSPVRKMEMKLFIYSFLNTKLSFRIIKNDYSV